MLAAEIKTVKPAMQAKSTFRARWLFLLPIALVIVASLQIALKTSSNAHPDEVFQLDAMCYFESHWWPPALNSNELIYSPYGWSRVYTGELVFLLYGKAGDILNPIAASIFMEPLPIEASIKFAHSNYLPLIMMDDTCQPIYQTYRLFNVLLLFSTLVGLLVIARHSTPLFLVGITMLCIPQAIYSYSYANSDTWGLSISFLIFAFIMSRRHIWKTLRSSIIFGLLVGLLLLSKQSSWLSLMWIGVLLLEDLYSMKQQWGSWSTVFRQVRVPIAICAGVILLLIAPSKIIYPVSQGDWSAQIEMMRETRAKEGFRPSNPTQDGYRLAEKGEPVTSVINRAWLRTTSLSFYGVFGYLSSYLPMWAYKVVLIVASTNILATLLSMQKRWDHIDLRIRILILTAPPIIIGTVAASVYNSWFTDYQPQGRYLFACLVPLSMLLWGTFEVEGKKLQGFRIASWLLGFAICLYALFGFAVV